MSLEPLFECLPAEAAYRRVPLPDDENALGPWRAAVERFVPGVDLDLWAELLDDSGDEEDQAALIAAQVLRPMRELVAANAHVFELLDAGLRLGRFQFPDVLQIEQVSEDSEFACGLSEVAQLPLVRARLRSAGGDWSGAAADLLGLFRMGHMVCRGEGQVLQYLIGLWIRGTARRAMGPLAAHQDAPGPALHSLLAAVEQALAEADGLETSLRVDLCRLSLPQLDRMPDAGDLETLVDGFLANYFHEEPGEADPWQVRRRQQVIELLHGHARPFSKAATARLMGEIVVDSTDEMERLSKEGEVPRALSGKRRATARRRHLERQVRHWPVQLAPGFHGRSDEGGRSPWTDIAASTEGEEEMPPGDPVHLDDAEVAAARRALRRVDNPMGLVLAQHLLAFDYVPFMIQHRGKLKETREMLAARVRGST